MLPLLQVWGSSSSIVYALTRSRSVSSMATYQYAGSTKQAANAYKIMIVPGSDYSAHGASELKIRSVATELIIREGKGVKCATLWVNDVAAPNPQIELLFLKVGPKRLLRPLILVITTAKSYAANGRPGIDRVRLAHSLVRAKSLQTVASTIPR